MKFLCISLSVCIGTESLFNAFHIVHHDETVFKYIEWNDEAYILIFPQNKSSYKFNTVDRGCMEVIW